MVKPTIVFMGTPDFAVPALGGLIRSGYPIIGVVTQPDRPKGRGRAVASSPVKAAAESLGLRVLQPEKVRSPEFLQIFAEMAPDLVIVAAFGQILPGQIIRGPKMGCINIHPSLLPKYRGAAPMNWALIRGEEKTGVTIMQMDEGVDSGPILLQEETPIGPEENLGQLHDRLAKMGTELLLITLAMAGTGTLVPQPQNHALATLAPRLGREDGEIHWTDDARTIVSLIRGLSPTPCAYTFFNGKQMKVYAATGETGVAKELPGTVVEETPGGLRIAAGTGYVLLKEIQIEGKKRLPMNDFLRGVKIAQGETLGGKQT